MMKVRKSINIKYDLSDTDLLREYYATSSHSEIIKTVFRGVLGHSSRSHMVFGPYGAGKSYITTIISGFLSKRYRDNSEVELFIEKFKNVDVESADFFNKVNQMDMEYIPIVINGFEGNFDKTVLKYLGRQVYEHTGILISNKKQQIESIIENWEANFLNTYNSFEEYLNTKKLERNAFLLMLDDDSIFLDFLGFYSSVTSGASLPMDLNLDLLSTLESVSRQLAEKNLGIILIYDEFGRMLQNIAQHELNKFMQQLQDLAELANNSSKNLSLLFITHKPVSHYFSYLDKDKRAEFSKIEKRFTISNISNDNSTFLNITQQVIREYRSFEPSDEYRKYNLDYLRKFRLFSSSLNETEIENNIIIGCFPVHPISIHLLPIISKIYGQNERTLFSFLSDESSLGILGFIEKSKDSKKTLYTPDLLVDYFLMSIDNSEISESKEFKIFRSNFDELPLRFEGYELNIAEKIFKFIMIWNMTGSNNLVLINDELIVYALSERKENVYKVLEKLSDLKYIRFNRIKRYWQLIESSFINLEEELTKFRNQNKNISSLLISKLNQYNPYKYLFPKKHNNAIEMTRFAVSRINLPNSTVVDLSLDNYDFIIDIFVNCKPSFQDKQLQIYSETEIDLEGLRKLIEKLVLIDSLLADRHLLLENRNAQSDLEYEKSLVIKDLGVYYYTFYNNAYFKSEIGEFLVKSITDLENYLDQIADYYFHKSIIIQNDQINMFVITKQQESPIIQLISKMMKYETNSLDKYITGHKPDSLIYYSLKQANFDSVKDRIIEFVKTKNIISFSELVNIVTSPPYGLRPTISALVIVYLTIGRWKNFMFFRNGNYIVDLNAETIYKAGLKLTDFELVYSDFEFLNNDFLMKILQLFNNVSEGVINKSLSIKVLSSLNNWLISLPVITQLGENLSTEEISLIRTIQKSKVNPTESLHEIIMNYTYQEIVMMKNTIEESFEHYLSTFEENIRNEFEIINWREWALEKSIVKRKSNRLVSLSIEYERILEKYSESLDKLDMKRWPIAMFDMLKRSIESDILDADGKIDTIQLVIGGVLKEVDDIELTNKAINLERNLTNLINANSKYLNYAEIEKVVIELAKKYIK